MASVVAAAKGKGEGCAAVLSGRRETSSVYEDWPVDACDRIEGAVGGSFEGLVINARLECYVNEAGMVDQLPQNEAAAYALEHLGVRIPSPGLVWGPLAILFRWRADFLAFKERWFDLYQRNELPEEDE